MMIAVAPGAGRFSSGFLATTLTFYNFLNNIKRPSLRTVLYINDSCSACWRCCLSFCLHRFYSFYCFYYFYPLHVTLLQLRVDTILPPAQDNMHTVPRRFALNRHRPETVSCLIDNAFLPVRQHRIYFSAEYNDHPRQVKPDHQDDNAAKAPI